MAKKKSSIDLEHLKHWQKCSPESTLEWLASAVEFSRIAQKALQSKKR